MANEGPSLTKATYDKKRTRGPAPSPARVEVARQEKITAAAESRRFLKLMHNELARLVPRGRTPHRRTKTARATDEASQAILIQEVASVAAFIHRDAVIDQHEPY